MDKSTWTHLLIAATVVVLAAAGITVAVARPRRQVLVPFLPTLAVSIAIYAAMVDGASSFHSAFVICASIAIGFAGVLVLVQPARNRIATFSWALLGVVTPYTLLILLLFMACHGQSECLG